MMGCVRASGAPDGSHSRRYPWETTPEVFSSVFEVATESSRKRENVSFHGREHR